MRPSRPARLGRSAAAQLVGALAFVSLAARTRHVVRSMRRARIARPWRTAFAMYTSLARSALDWLAASRARFAPSSLPVHVPAELVAALAEGVATGGALVCASHTDNWELAAYALARRFAVTALVKRQHVGWADRLCNDVRRAYGVELVFADEVARDESGATNIMAALADRLRRGRVVLMVTDQVPLRAAQAECVPFLGADAWVDRAPFALAARTGATLVVAAQRWLDERVRIELLGVFKPPLTGRSAWVQATLRVATARLERFVQAYPESWLWLHKRWRDPARRSDLARAKVMLKPAG